jgi:hypothetical protein
MRWSQMASQNAVNFIMDSRRPRLINSYALENAAQDPASDTDAGIAGSIAGALESAAGFQSNPLIRRAIEEYAMAWAEKHLTKLQYAPVDTQAIRLSM